jgi:hypothetical protein
MIIPGQFGFNCPSGFREEAFWNIFLGRLEPNLAGMFLGWSSTKLLFFVPVGYSIWLPGPIIGSDWLKFQRSSSLKLMNWLNPNCKWMIIGMSFTKNVSKRFFSETTWHKYICLSQNKEEIYSRQQAVLPSLLIIYVIG